MPAGDRTGPEGMGPQTGRGAGYCTGNDQPGYAYSRYGRGYRNHMFGGRRFFGRGFRGRNRMPMHAGWMGYGAYPGAYPPPAPMTEEQEQEALKSEESWLQEQLDAVRERMKKE